METLVLLLMLLLGLVVPLEGQEQEQSFTVFGFQDGGVFNDAEESTDILAFVGYGVSVAVSSDGDKAVFGTLAEKAYMYRGTGSSSKRAEFISDLTFVNSSIKEYGSVLAVNTNTLLIAGSDASGVVEVHSAESGEWELLGTFSQQQEVISMDIADDDTIVVGTHLGVYVGIRVAAATGPLPYLFNTLVSTESRTEIDFVVSISRDGKHIAVGRLSGDRVQMYERNPNNGFNFVSTLFDAGVEGFGSALKVLSGDMVIVGSPVGGALGQVKVFEATPNGESRWTQKALLEPNATTSSEFGFAVAAVDPSTIVVGAPGDHGAVFVFSENPNTGEYIVTQQIEQNVGGEFGAALAMTSDRALFVGGPSEGEFETGLVYVYSAIPQVISSETLPPTLAPSPPPTFAPSRPTNAPTSTPVVFPTSLAPTLAPTSLAPTLAPTSLAPTLAPTSLAPTLAPTSLAPTFVPTSSPTDFVTPTSSPTDFVAPTSLPTDFVTPTGSPSGFVFPTSQPTSGAPTTAPTEWDDASLYCASGCTYGATDSYACVVAAKEDVCQPVEGLENWPFNADVTFRALQFNSQSTTSVFDLCTCPQPQEVIHLDALFSNVGNGTHDDFNGGLALAGPGAEVLEIVWSSERICFGEPDVWNGNSSNFCAHNTTGKSCQTFGRGCEVLDDDSGRYVASGTTHTCFGETLHWGPRQSDDRGMLFPVGIRLKRSLESMEGLNCSARIALRVEPVFQSNGTHGDVKRGLSMECPRCTQISGSKKNEPPPQDVEYEGAEVTATVLVATSVAASFAVAGATGGFASAIFAMAQASATDAMIVLFHAPGDYINFSSSFYWAMFTFIPFQSSSSEQQIDESYDDDENYPSGRSLAAYNNNKTSKEEWFGMARYANMVRIPDEWLLVSCLIGILIITLLGWAVLFGISWWKKRNNASVREAFVETGVMVFPMTAFPLAVFTSYTFFYLASSSDLSVGAQVGLGLLSSFVFVFGLWAIWKGYFGASKLVKDYEDARTAYKILIRIWKEELFWFWIVKIVSDVIKGILVGAVLNPIPIQPAFIFGVNLAYMIALVRYSPYKNKIVNGFALFVAICVMIASILPIAFAVDPTIFTEEGLDLMGQVQIWFKLIVFFLFFILTFLIWMSKQEKSSFWIFKWFQRHDLDSTSESFKGQDDKNNKETARYEPSSSSSSEKRQDSASFTIRNDDNDDGYNDDFVITDIDSNSFEFHKTTKKQESAKHSFALDSKDLELEELPPRTWPPLSFTVNDTDNDDDVIRKPDETSSSLQVI